MNIYSIKNEKLGYFNRPIFCESDIEARSLILNILMSDSDRAMVGLKGDLSLYYLGHIDFKSGLISPSFELNECCSDDSDDIYKPLFVCSLDDLFEMIPKDKLKPAVTRDELLKLVDEIDHLGNKFVELSSNFDNHTHTHKKGVLKIESNS